MCTPESVTFIETALNEAEVTGKRLIEVGSYDVNGSVRRSIEARGTASYVGVDIEAGPSVDVVWDATKLLDRFEPNSFDVVCSTEAVEHIRDWCAAFTNMKRLCALLVASWP